MRSSVVRRSIIQSALLLGASSAAALAMQVGCSSSAEQPSGQTAQAPGSSESAGTVQMKLSLPGGETVNTANWIITGPNGGATPVKSGSVNVSGSQSISFVVAGLAPATGYTVSITAVTTDGTVTCSGSAQFNIVARQTTLVTDLLACSAAVSEAGSVAVNASTYNCGVANAISASPSAANVGGTIAVSASGTGANATALTYAWSAPSGSFDTPNAPSANYTCTTAGPVTLSVTVSDGPVPDGGTCNAASSTTTVVVQCQGHLDSASQFATATKIKHVVVIFGENISFDHYFGTYPNAANLPSETPFTAAAGTPTANNLQSPLDPTKGFAPVSGVNLLTNNPNLNAANGAGASNPFRLAPAQAETNDQGHNYKPEQQASDNTAMDLFPLYTGNAGPPPTLDAGAPPASQTKGLVMAYYDGNTVSTMWNLAQAYALNDNSWSTVFGPSTPGAINLISGQTNGFAATNKAPSTMSPNHVVADGNGGFTMIGDTDPLGDVCSTAADQNLMSGKNIGDLLNAKGITWGWFEGGFDLTLTNANGTTGCLRSSAQVVPFGGTTADYIPHHQPFQYYASTANPTHARPSSLAAIGKSLEADGVTPEPANHQYDAHDFFDALGAGNLPAVVYLKAPAFEDGHGGYSDPIDEQNFVNQVLGALQGSQEWSSTAIVLAYDDSDGWYDHQAPSIVNPSSSIADALNGAGLCNSGAQQGGAAPTTPLLGAPPADGGAPVPVQGRCGYGTRMPLLVVSPFAKRNTIDHTLTDQTSVLRFIEDNWLASQRVQPGGSFDTIANSITGMLNL